MTDYVSVGRVADFREGIVRVFELESGPVAVVQHAGAFYGFSGRCSHEDHSFNYTRVRPGDRIICSSHLAVFELATGKVIAWPELEPLAVFDVRVEGDEVLVSNRPAAAAR